MAEVDAKLAQSLRSAKSAPMFFAFVAKGASDGVLLVSRKPPTGGEIKEAKLKCGGTAVLTGRCLGEDNTTVFELPTEPPGSLAGQLKKIIARDAGLTLTVETRCNKEMDGAAAPAADGVPEAPPPPEAPTADLGTFKARFKVVSPLYKEAAKKAPAYKAVLDKVAASAAGAAKAGQYGEGLTQLQKLETASKQILAKAAAAAPEPPVAPPAPPAPPAPAASATGDVAAFRQRMKEVLPLYQQASKQAPDRKGELDKLATQAAEAGKQKDYAAAVGLLGRLETSAQTILQTAAPAANAKGPSLVAFQQLRLKWEAARKSATEDMRKLQEKILADFKGVPEFASVAEAVKVMDNALSGFDERLTDKLDEALNAATPEERQKKLAEAGPLVATYRAEMAKLPFLQALDKNPFMDAKIYATLNDTLNLVAQQLGA